MNACDAVFDLYEQDDRCVLPAGHHGPHAVTCWGPTILWHTPNHAWTEPTA